MLRPYYQNAVPEAGCDEAGRGCLAGPVFAAAVILPQDFFHPLLNDSKQVAEEDRNELRRVIEKKAITYAVAQVDHDEIDRINILKASFKAMHLALEELATAPQFLIIDGDKFIPYKKTPHRCVVKGDSIYASVAAASILAKTYRDEFMRKLHSIYPHYGWDHNKGYATEEHRNAIAMYGLSIFHRRTFHCSSNQLLLDL
jgi:ribonuclease HII